MNDIIKVTNSMEYSGVLVDGVTGTTKHETNIKEVDLLELC